MDCPACWCVVLNYGGPNLIMVKVVEWISQNWKSLTLVLGFIFLFSLLKPIADMLRNAKEGVRELFTPLGFLVFLVLIIFGIWLLTQTKGMW